MNPLAAETIAGVSILGLVFVCVVVVYFYSECRSYQRVPDYDVLEG